MRELYVFLASKNNLYSILVTEQSETVIQKTERTNSDDKSTIIQAMITALACITQYVNDSECKVCFVVSNNYLQKWIENGYSKPEYKNEFNNLYELFQALPMQYSFLTNIQNRAVAYLKYSYIVKPQISGTSSLLDSFSEE